MLLNGKEKMVALKALKGALGMLFGSLVVAWVGASTILDLVAVWVAFGWPGVILALVMAPLAFFVAPFYAAFVQGFWWPLIVEYGGLLVLGAVFPLMEHRGHGEQRTE